MSDEQLRPQRRNRRVAMTGAEVDEFLRSERTCRLATVSSRGPHLTALWFVWQARSIWLYSITRSQRWVDLAADPRVAVLVDSGREYSELCGVEITGVAEVVGEVPRVGEPRVGEPRAELDEPEREFAAKYFGSDRMVHDHRHAWLRVRPSKITTWDFRKIG